MINNLLDAVNFLKTRGLFQECSEAESLKNIPLGSSFYVGLDPTAPSLQLGNFVPIFVSAWLGKLGFKPIILFGGATGMVGDPSGRSKERPLLDLSSISENVKRHSKQVEKIMYNIGVKEVAYVNNADWTAPVSFLEFLRDTGKYITVNYMLAKDSVKSRLEDGISYTEFSYMLLQAFDFKHLFLNHNCKFQIGASDQWGNITAGLELIRKNNLGNAAAFCFPLLTDASGRKFSKSEGNTLWLDPDLTSPYKLYQYFMNLEDQYALDLCKKLTFAEEAELANLVQATKEKPEARTAQKYLGKSICSMIHGEEASEEAEKTSNNLFQNNISELSESQILEIFSEAPSYEINRAELNKIGLLEIFKLSELSKSNGEARRLIAGGGAYINEKRVESEDKEFWQSELNKSLIVLRSGKKKYALLKVI